MTLVLEVKQKFFPVLLHSGTTGTTGGVIPAVGSRWSCSTSSFPESLTQVVTYPCVQHEEGTDHQHQPPAAPRWSVQDVPGPAEPLEQFGTSSLTADLHGSSWLHSLFLRVTSRMCFPVWLQTPGPLGGGRGVLQRLLQAGGRETLHVS